jgi:short subunit dehydrogenase-like uncharacterized protein
LEKNKVLVYGASGYVGQLFTKESKDSGLHLILAGRNTMKTDYSFRKFSLEDKSTILENIKDVKLLINLAGPFKHTAHPLVEACIQNGTHYIDIAGEYKDFETTYSYNDLAQKAGIMLMPGAGFGVAPTDIVANLAKAKLPDAIHLKIAYNTVGGASRGTLKTILSDIDKEGVILKNGNFSTIKPASLFYSFNLHDKNYSLVYNPWRADLFSARISTGIQNIETYSNFPPIVVKMMNGKLLWLRKIIIKYLLNLLPIGPTEKQLKKGRTVCYAEVSNKEGVIANASIIGPEAYLFTVKILLIISKEIIANNYKTGYQTPNIYADKILKLQWI